jgi:hypothetical protein
LYYGNIAQWLEQHPYTVPVKGSSPFISTKWSVARVVRASSAKGLFTSSNLVLASLFSYGATVARLILVQQIVVRIHVGKRMVFIAGVKVLCI